MSAAIWAVAEVTFPSTWRHLAKQGQGGASRRGKQEGTLAGHPLLGHQSLGSDRGSSCLPWSRKKLQTLLSWQTQNQDGEVLEGCLLCPLWRSRTQCPLVPLGFPAGMPIEGFPTLFLQGALNASLPYVGPRYISKRDVWLPKWETGAKHPATPWLAIAAIWVTAKCLQLKIHQ